MTFRTAKRTGEPTLSAGPALFATILLLAVLAALGLRTIATLPLDALAPVVASLLFALAAVCGCSALLMRRRTWMYDLAGLLTFVGIIVSLTIESDQMTRLMVLSENSDSH